VTEPPRLGRLKLDSTVEASDADARKLAGPLADRLNELDDDDLIAAIVEVTKPGYTPAAAERRADLSGTLFTANVRRGRLRELTHDPHVASIELSQRLRRID
jgi:hypothetical protein